MIGLISRRARFLWWKFSRYFSDEKVSPLFGISYLINNKTLLKIEHDPTLTPGKVGYEESNSQFSYGLDFLLTKISVLAYLKKEIITSH